MRLMTNNLWNCDRNYEFWIARGADCSADGRIGGLTAAYRAIHPDVMCFQEMSRHMEELILGSLRHADFGEAEPVPFEIITGGYTPILYRRDRLRLLEAGYSCFPKELPGFAGEFNDADSKGYTFGVFEQRASGKRFAVFSAHLWWMAADPSDPWYREGSAEARVAQIGLVTRRAEELTERYGCPAFLMGDLNDTLAAPSLRSALADGWEQTHELCRGERDEGHGHHICYPDRFAPYEPKPYREAIDHILIRNRGETAIERFLRYTEPSFEPLSDHFPVYVDITL